MEANHKAEQEAALQEQKMELDKKALDQAA